MLQLNSSRTKLGSQVNNISTFGQAIAVVLLAAPLMSIVELWSEGLTSGWFAFVEMPLDRQLILV